MSFRRLFYRTLAVLIAGFLVYVWFGIVYLLGGFQPWVYQLLGGS